MICIIFSILLSNLIYKLIPQPLSQDPTSQKLVFKAHDFAIYLVHPLILHVFQSIVYFIYIKVSICDL